MSENNNMIGQTQENNISPSSGFGGIFSLFGLTQPPLQTQSQPLLQTQSQNNNSYNNNDDIYRFATSQRGFMYYLMNYIFH